MAGTIYLVLSTAAGSKFYQMPRVYQTRLSAIAAFAQAQPIITLVTAQKLYLYIIYAEGNGP